MGDERDAVQWVPTEPGVRVRAGGRLASSAPSGADAARPGPVRVRRRGGWLIGVAVAVLALVVLRVLVYASTAADPASALPPGELRAEPGARQIVTSAPPEASSGPGDGPESLAGPSPSSLAGPSPSSLAGPSPSSLAGPSPSTVAGPSPSIRRQEGLGDPEAIDWWDVLRVLDSRRSAAFAQVDPELVGRYADVGSPAWEQDRATIDDLHRSGLVPVGLSTRVIGIEQVPEVPAGADRVEVVLVDRRGKYQVKDARGDVVDEVPASPLRRWRVLLVPDTSADVEVGWRLESVEALP